MTYILGLNAYHGDASACILLNGELIAAVEEERYRRIKHWAGFPSKAIEYCLREAGVSFSEVDHVAINRDPKANLLKKFGFTLKQRPELNLLISRLKNARDWSSLEDEIVKKFPRDTVKAKFHYVEHHLAHLGSAHLVSPFKESVVVSVDGFGDFASAAWGVGRDRIIEVADKIYFPHSLGIFYQALTQYIGFPHYGDEYKVMGLAPYGEPKFMPEMRRIVILQEGGTFQLATEYFRHHREKVEYEWDGCSPKVGKLYSDALEELFGPARRADEPLTQRHMDIARSIQAMYEEAFFYLLNSLHHRYGIDNLSLAGGCAMNSVANGKVTRMTPFNKVYVQSAAGDAGGAIGAAFVVHYETSKLERSFVMDHAYWGPQYTNKELHFHIDKLRIELEKQGCSIVQLDDEDELCEKSARAIADGQVVGWFQGRMEWGPRSLGNRSILCDPRRADMKDILNLKIKRRESFRPFAPSILREKVVEWFEIDDDVPFMMKVFPFKEEVRTQVPAVTHADGSGRLQTVYKETNPRYYHLITVFERLTGVPIVLNTSFNENEPVVCRPEEALDCFLRTKMDVLVLGNYFISRA